MEQLATDTEGAISTHSAPFVYESTLLRRRRKQFCLNAASQSQALSSFHSSSAP